MALTNKIISLYPELQGTPFVFQGIEVKNDSDGRGDYIAAWNHPTLPRPTDAQLEAAE